METSSETLNFCTLMINVTLTASTCLLLCWQRILTLKEDGVWMWSTLDVPLRNLYFIPFLWEWTKSTWSPQVCQPCCLVQGLVLGLAPAFKTFLTLERPKPGREGKRAHSVPGQEPVALAAGSCFKKENRRKERDPEHIHAAGTVSLLLVPREVFAGFLLLFLSWLPNWHLLPSAFSSRSLPAMAQLMRNGFWFCSHVEYAQQH